MRACTSDSIEYCSSKIVLKISRKLKYTALILWSLDFQANQGENDMTVRISKLFGMDIYTTDSEYKGKVFDLVINLEKGKIETITTEPLKARSKHMICGTA